MCVLSFFNVRFKVLFAFFDPSYKLSGVCVCFLHFHTVCSASLFEASSDIKVTIPVGKFFTHELLRETFQNDFEPLGKVYGETE